MPKPKHKPKPKAKPAKALAKKSPNKSQDPSPDWLRKAMHTAPKPKGRPPGSKNKPKTPQTQAKKGRKPMAIKPHYDPTDDPDLRAGTKGDAPVIDPKPPGYRPPDYSIEAPDQSLPENPVRPGQPLPLPGGGVRPDNALPEPEEEAPKYDEVASGEVIPPENAQMLIAGTLGGSGDNHASAKRILERFTEAGWELRKALDADTGDTKRAKGKKGKEDDAKFGKA
jgi:hypothetical protein